MRDCKIRFLSVYQLSPRGPAVSETLETGLADIEADVRRSLETLHEPGNLIKLSIFNGAKVGSNYYSDFDQLTEDILRFEREKHANYQYYITLNELNPDIATRRNSIKWGREAQPTTADPDVIRRRYIYVDFDPVRSSGISATDSEKEKSRDLLRGRGFPERIVADSGNGYWLLSRVDIPADPGNYDRDNTALHRGFLQFIKSNVDHDGVSIDLKVVNAARIVKLFGTVSRNGINTVDRPHRRSRLIENPELQEILSIETLKEVFKITGTDRGTSTKRDLSRLDVATKLQEWDVAVRRVKEDANGTRYILETCPFNSANDRGEAWIYQFADEGAITAKCHHESCLGFGWHDMRGLYEPGYAPQRILEPDRGQLLIIPHSNVRDKIAFLFTDGRAIVTHPNVNTTNSATMPITTYFRLKPNIVGTDILYRGCCSHSIDAADGAAYGGDAAALTNALSQFAQNSASGGFSLPQFRQFFLVGHKNS